MRSDGFEVGEAPVGVDIDVGAHVAGAEGDFGFDQQGAAGFDGDGQAGAVGLFAGDALFHRGAAGVAGPGRAPQDLVEMDVAFDQRWDQQAAHRVGSVGAGGWGAVAGYHDRH